MAIREVRSASAEHVEDMSYLVTRLQADPRAAVFAPQVKTDSAALQARNEDWNLHRHAVQEARSGVRSANESLTFVVRSVHGTILENLRHNRRSPAYLTYFPFGLTAFTRTSHEDQVTAVRALARQCAQDPSPKTREGAGLLHAELPTVHSKTMGEALDSWDIIRAHDLHVERAQRWLPSLHPTAGSRWRNSRPSRRAGGWATAWQSFTRANGTGCAPTSARPTAARAQYHHVPGGRRRKWRRRRSPRRSARL